MTPVARALTGELLAHHRHVCRPGRPIRPCLIAYADLCERAGYPELTRVVGRFLRETAAWCAERHLPPINALAVNGEAEEPGDGYGVAPGCSLLGWPDEVRRCIACVRYPADAG